MVPKRHFHEDHDDGSEFPVQESKRRLKFATVVRDVMNGLSLHEIASKLEPLIRTVVREELERGILLFLRSSPRPSLNQNESSVARGWQLHFVNKLPSTLFTGSKVEAEDNTPIKIVIVDANSKHIIQSGPLSSVKIEILVLDGDFGTDEQEDWTEKEFNARVIREREGKRPLVTGELVITLRNGVGSISDVTFTDNSSWIRSRKFRLGARTVQSISSEVRIREARSEAFVVKDHRGELYKKHHPPSLGDEIWRLEKIAKDGAFHKRLASNRISRITTVKDFLRLLVTDPSSLRSILGSGVSNKTWEKIIEHANACVLDDDMLYMYFAVQSVRLLFNCIYIVVGATFDGQNYQSLDKLTISQRLLVEELKRHAYKNLKDLVLIDEPSVLGLSMPLLSLQADPVSSSSLGLQQLDFPDAHQGQLEKQGFNCSIASSSYTYDVEDSSQLEEVSAVQSFHPMQVFTPALRNSFVMRDYCSGPYSGGNGWAPSGSLGPDVPTGHLAANDISQVQMSTWFPVNATWGQGNGLLLASTSEAEVGILSRGGKPKARWCKIRAAVKWGISVRRDVAAKRMARWY